LEVDSKGVFSLVDSLVDNLDFRVIFIGKEWKATVITFSFDMVRLVEFVVMAEIIDQVDSQVVKHSHSQHSGNCTID
jgi:hypothetical protein